MSLSTTKVTFPSGSVEERSTVVAVTPMGSRHQGVLTALTPFHPLDHTWPDQPADTGVLEVEGDDGLDTFPVVDCLTAAAHPVTGEIVIGEAIPVRRDEATWTWHVLHIVERDASALVGKEVRLAVDQVRRDALSAAHTGCHLLAMALNAALAGHWRKDAPTDSFGNPDFDSLAMASSRISERASEDVYRLGKSLRKKGFIVKGLAEELPAITEAVNTRLAGWLATHAPVRVEVAEPELTARRRWTCALPEGVAAISCGGTHVRGLSELTSLTTELSLSDDESELTAVTTPIKPGSSA